MFLDLILSHNTWLNGTQIESSKLQAFLYTKLENPTWRICKVEPFLWNDLYYVEATHEHIQYFHCKWSPMLVVFQTVRWITKDSLYEYTYMKVKVLLAQWCLTLCDPMDCGLCPWYSPGQNTGVGSYSLLQGIFLTQGSNPVLPHCRQILYQLRLKGSPRILEWVAYPFPSRYSWPRNWTGVSCIAGGFFTNWAIREAQLYRYS